MISILSLCNACCDLRVLLLLFASTLLPFVFQKADFLELFSGLTSCAVGLVAFLNSPVGPKTGQWRMRYIACARAARRSATASADSQSGRAVHFWAPSFKWALVIAGLADIQTRPAEKISPAQVAALSATGIIWARYATQIRPVNYNLLAVNIFVGITGCVAILLDLCFCHISSLTSTLDCIK